MSNLTKEQSEWAGKAEAMMMLGNMQPIESEEEAIFIAGYIAKTLRHTATGEQILTTARRYFKKDKYDIPYMGVTNSDFGRLITMPLATKTRKTPLNLFDRNGVLSYVYNLDAPDCSEGGSCWFRNVNGMIKREA